MRVTVFPERTVALYSGVPWWIIVVAVLAGILMLALLVFLLWKVSTYRTKGPVGFGVLGHEKGCCLQ